MDVRVGGERGDELVDAVAGGVVQQDAHAYATVCGLEQLFDQQAGAEAVLNDVVLQIEAGLCIANSSARARNASPLLGSRRNPDWPGCALASASTERPKLEVSGRSISLYVCGPGMLLQPARPSARHASNSANHGVFKRRDP
jgi:hypothetical protein